MKAKDFFWAALPVAAFLCWEGWGPPARPAPDSTAAATSAAATPAPSSSSTSKSKTKEKHWSGSLVDVGCMAKALQTSSGAATPNASPTPDTPHFADQGAGMPQAGQTPTPGGAGGAGSIRNPGMGSAPYPTTETTSPQDQARAAQQARMDSATKQCSATPSTQNFGLVTSGGQVIQFDTEGNAKASEALKQNPVESGKQVKAKVAGTMENNSTVDVASVDIKAPKGKKPAT
jgi:hypothetical protein